MADRMREASPGHRTQGKIKNLALLTIRCRPRTRFGLIPPDELIAQLDLPGAGPEPQRGQKPAVGAPNQVTHFGRVQDLWAGNTMTTPAVTVTDMPNTLEVSGWKWRPPASH